MKTELYDFLTFVADMPAAFAVHGENMSAHQFWKLLGSSKFPNLYVIADRLFSIPTSSASSERLWSVFDFIHSCRRNRLLNEKVNKLVFVYANAALLSQHEHEIDFFEMAVALEDLPDIEDDD